MPKACTRSIRCTGCGIWAPRAASVQILTVSVRTAAKEDEMNSNDS